MKIHSGPQSVYQLPAKPSMTQQSCHSQSKAFWKILLVFKAEPSSLCLDEVKIAWTLKAVLVTILYPRCEGFVASFTIEWVRISIHEVAGGFSQMHPAFKTAWV